MSQRGEKKNQDRLKRQRMLADRARRQAILQRERVSVDSVLQLAVAGKSDQALQAAATLTQQTPDAWQAWNLLATLQDHLRQFQEAEKSYRRVTQLAPDRREGWHGLGKVLCTQQSTQEALVSLQRAVEIGGDDSAVLRDLARTFLVAGNLPEAHRIITLARDLSPQCPDCWNVLGLVTQQIGNIEEAAIAFCRAAELRPKFVDALANLGECLRDLGDLEQAQQILDQALLVDPNHANALGFSGMLAAMLGQRSRAVELLQRALDRNPRYRLFRLQLARCHAGLGQLESALEQLDVLQQRFGEQSDLLLERSGIEAVAGRLDESRIYLAKILAREPKHLVARLRNALLVPQIAQDNFEIAECRRRLSEQVDALLQEPCNSLEVPLDDFANAHFYLTYHGQNNVDINRQISRLFRNVVPGANYVHDRMADLRRLQHVGSKIRVAFVSKNFSNHTIGRLNIGLVQALDRQRFEVTTCVFPGSSDSFQQKFQQASDHFVVLPPQPPQAAAALAQHQPDIIFYADIGMDPTTYFMAHTRIAPIQCTTWGHPVTTGISTMDYYLSSEYMDSEASHAHYSEKLVVLRNMLLYYERPALISEEVNKSLLGLPERLHLYLCPQTLFKIHPDFDQILGEILKSDPDGLILMVKLGHEAWRQKLMARFERVIPDVSKRILWMDRMSAMKFQHLFRMGDVALDPYKFGSGNTCLEALGMGMPLVTCPDEFMRTRMAISCYQRMGITDPVVATPDEYVERVVQIARDRDYRQYLSEEIRQRSDVLFGNLAAVRELEGWMESAIACQDNWATSKESMK